MFDKYTSDIASFSLRFVWCVSEYVLSRVAFVAGVVFDVIKEFSAAGDGRFSLATQWPSPSGGGFFISRAMQVKGIRIKLIHGCRGIRGRSGVRIHMHVPAGDPLVTGGYPGG